jgi:hypothetical protein
MSPTLYGFLALLLGLIIVGMKFSTLPRMLGIANASPTASPAKSKLGRVAPKTISRENFAKAADVRALSKQIHELHTRADRSDLELGKAKGQIAVLQRALHDSYAVCRTLNATNVRLTKMVGTMAAMSNHHDEYIKRLEQKQNELYTSLHSYTEGRAPKNIEVDVAIGTFRDDIDTINKQVQQLQDQLAALSTKATTLHEDHGQRQHGHGAAWTQVRGRAHGASGSPSQRQAQKPPQADGQQAAPEGGYTFIMKVKPGNNPPPDLRPGKGSPRVFVAGMLRHALHNLQLQISWARVLPVSQRSDGSARPWAVVFTVPTLSDAELVRCAAMPGDSDFSRGWQLRECWPKGARERLGPLIERAKSDGERWRPTRDHSQLQVLRNQRWVTLELPPQH